MFREGLPGKSGWLQQLVRRGHGSALPLGYYCTGSTPWPQMWLYPVRVCPHDPTHRWAIGGGGHSPPKMLAANTREAGKVEVAAQQSPFLDTDGGAGKPSSERTAAH